MFVELSATSNFTFLTGASHPEDYVLRAAERFGFSYEGLFRQHMVIKNRNRDTAWYSIIDSEWPALAAGYERWLAADNFSADGQQKQRLEDLR